MLIVSFCTLNEAEALEWVKESLEDVLEDRDEESIEGVPMVPITDSANAAMDSPNFQRFLRALGIEPPSDEQESFWRLPSNMLSSTIRKRVELITDGLAGKFVEEGTYSSARTPSLPDIKLRLSYSYSFFFFKLILP